MTKKKIILRWKFKDLPNAGEIASLVERKVVTAEEARKILFSEVEMDESDRDSKSYRSEIVFLREIISQLAKTSKEITTIIKEVPVYKKYPWYEGYTTWATWGNNPLVGTTTSVDADATTLAMNSSGNPLLSEAYSCDASNGTLHLDVSTADSFKNIKTF